MPVEKQRKYKYPCALLRFEGVGWCVVEAGIGKDGQGAHGSNDDKDPEEHAVHHHGNVLPVLLQLAEDRWIKGRTETGGGKEGQKLK